MDNHATEEDKIERIRRRAHAIWENEGRPEGRALEHWEKASQDIALEQEQGFEPEADTTMDTQAQK